MIKKNNFRSLYALVLIFFSMAMVSQEKPDTQLRFNPSVSYDFTKKWGATFDYRLGYKENISQFQSSIFQISSDYELTKKIKVEAGYRYSTSYTKDYHRLFASVQYKYKWDRISLENTLKYQFQTGSFDSEYMQFFDTPTHTVREKVTMEYNVPKSKTTLFFAPEIFLRVDQYEVKFNRMRYTVGGTYQLKYGNTLGLSVFYDDYVKLSKTDRMVVVAKYNLSINDLLKKIKKVKKKKATKEPLK
jgi:hypothetical protein